MTTTTHIWDGEDTLRRARFTLETRRAQLAPMLLAYLSAIFFILIIIGACCSEFFSAGLGFNAAFPTKSDGTSLAGTLMLLRYPIIFCLLAGDVVLSMVPSRMKAMLDGVVHSIGIGAILLLLAGVGTFMFSATFLTLGSDDGQGFGGHLVGLALGIASAAMFTLSFLASHAVLGKLVVVLPFIAEGRTERARIAVGDAVVNELETGRANIIALRDTVTEMEKPNALRRKVANEAGVITGMVTSDAHDLVASRKLRGDRTVEPQDHCDVPDVPLEALEQRKRRRNPALTLSAYAAQQRLYFLPEPHGHGSFRATFLA